MHSELYDKFYLGDESGTTQATHKNLRTSLDSRHRITSPDRDVFYFRLNELTLLSSLEPSKVHSTLEESNAKD